MQTTTPEQKSFHWTWLLSRLALIVVSMTLTFGLLFFLVTTFTDIRLDKNTVQMIVKPGGERTIFTVYDGDTFHHQPGMVRPPEENRVLEDVIRYYDNNSFREPRLTADHYPIIALGDSFTEGGTTPWVDVLAEILDTPVQNLGWRGWGPVHEAEVMAQFGGSDHEWVLIAYFEGNDLSNIQVASDQIQNEGTLNIERWRTPPEDYETPDIELDSDATYLYPLYHEVDNRSFEMAYISDYLWWLNGSENVYRQSRNIALMQESLQRIHDLAGDACVALIYIPSKEHIYFPYSDPAGNQQYVMQNGLHLRLDDNGWLAFNAAPQNAEEVFASLDNQRNVVQEITTASGLQFIDLTPVFKEHALRDDLLYYSYDSHWSQTGHNLAGRIIAEYIEQREDCP